MFIIRPENRSLEIIIFECGHGSPERAHLFVTLLTLLDLCLHFTGWTSRPDLTARHAGRTSTNEFRIVTVAANTRMDVYSGLRETRHSQEPSTINPTHLELKAQSGYTLAVVVALYCPLHSPLQYTNGGRCRAESSEQGPNTFLILQYFLISNIKYKKLLIFFGSLMYNFHHDFLLIISRQNHYFLRSNE